MWRCEICSLLHQRGDCDCPRCGMRQWSAVWAERQPAAFVAHGPRCNLCGEPSARLMRRAVCPGCEAARVPADDDPEPPSRAAVCGMLAGAALVWACTIRGLMAFLGW
jgi:hypothetical protein